MRFNRDLIFSGTVALLMVVCIVLLALAVRDGPTPGTNSGIPAIDSSIAENDSVTLGKFSPNEYWSFDPNVMDGSYYGTDTSSISIRSNYETHYTGQYYVANHGWNPIGYTIYDNKSGSLTRTVWDTVTQTGTWNIDDAGKLHITLYDTFEVIKKDGWGNSYKTRETNYSSVYLKSDDVTHYNDVAGRHHFWLWGWVFVQNFQSGRNYEFGPQDG
jgi:hypothetical protein